MKNLRLSQQEAARELLARRKARRNYADYCRYTAPDEPPAKHHLLITDVCDKIIEGEVKRALVMMPPGGAKSTYATVRFPPYFLGRKQKAGVITASYNDDLATHFGRKVRNIIKTPEYGRVFDTQLAIDSQAKGEWETQDGGFYFATGIGGSVTGRRADLGIIDDPIRGRKDADSELIRDNAWNWYINDFRTRLKPNAAILLIQTRWHMDDLAGRILPDDWNGESGWITAKDGEQWYVVCLPAQAGSNDILGRQKGDWLWTEWFDESFWEQTKKTAILHDVRTWNSLYQQTPTDEAGTYFQRSWFEQRYTELPAELNVYMSGDFAVTDGDGDFTELAVWGVDPQDRIYVLDWWSGQTTSEVWISQLLTMAKRWKAMRFIGEMGPIRRAVEPFLERTMRDTRTYVGLEWLASGGDKAASARSFQALASLNRVHFPRTEWAEYVISQLCKFPAGKYDDAVDACSLFGRFINDTWAALPPKQPEKAIEQLWNAPMKMTDFQNTERKSW